jgi:hypothetical protein
MPSPSLTGCMDDRELRSLGSAVSLHTPGPWRVGCDLERINTDYGTADDYVRGGWAKTVATIKYANWMGFEQASANARLIAAAPNMYEALKRARAQLVAIGGAPRPDERDFSNQGAVLDAVDAALSQVSDSERSSNVITNEVQS